MGINIFMSTGGTAIAVGRARREANFAFAREIKTEKDQGQGQR